MKHLINTTLTLLAVATIGADGADIRLAWDASATTGITNYVLYAATTTQTNIARLNVGTNLTARVESLQPGTWLFSATAMKGGVESDPSNILIVEVPQPPRNMRTVVVQYSGTLSNWYDVGFFRLRLP